MKNLKDAVNLINPVNDPVEAAKSMVSSIQRLTGIKNIFGDEDRNVTIPSFLATLVFGGTFVYLGTFSQLVYLFEVFPNKLESFKTINCISTTSIPLSKYFFIWLSRGRLRTIFELSHHGLALLSEGSAAKSKMLSTLQRARYASWFVIANLTFTHFIYLFIPFIFTVFGNDRYLPTTPGDSYGLSPKYETPFYQISFVVTCLATAFSAINQIGFIVLFISLLAHELGNFYAISETLREIYTILREQKDSELNDADIDNAIDERLIFCVKHHQFLILYHNKVRELYKVVFGAHFIMMTIVLVTTLQTMNEWDVRNTILTGGTGIMPLFLYCFGGELLISAGHEMSTSIYTCGWELMKPKQAKIALLMLCKAERPLYWMAADVFIMNRETFGAIVQVVYKVYAVFN